MKPLRVGGPTGEHTLDLVLGLENVSELEVERQLELVTAVSLVAVAPVHLLVDPGVVEPETAEVHADCLEELDGEW